MYASVVTNESDFLYNLKHFAVKFSRMLFFYSQNTSSVGTRFDKYHDLENKWLCTMIGIF